MSNTLKIKRGTIAGIPTLAAGELGFSTDTFELFIGDGATNRRILTKIIQDTTPQLGGDLDTNGKNINAINQTNAIENKSKLLQTKDIISDFVVSGLLPTTSANLISDISAGFAYVTGTRVVKAVTSKTYTASKDTYVDVNSVGTYTFVEVANGAAAPAVTADSIRLAKVITDATAITGVTDLRTVLAKINRALEITGQLTISGASRMRATRSTAQSTANSTWTIVQYNTETFDNLNEYDNATNYRFTAKEAGYYSVLAALLSTNAAWDAGEYWMLAIFKNGVNISTGHRNQADAAVTHYRPSQVNDMLYLAVNDYIDIRVHHNQGAAMETYIEAVYNYFSIHRLS